MQLLCVWKYICTSSTTQLCHDYSGRSSRDAEILLYICHEKVFGLVTLRREWYRQEEVEVCIGHKKKKKKESVRNEPPSLHDHLCIIYTEGNFQICWPICTSHSLQCSQNVSKQFSPCTWQPAFCLEKAEPEEGKYCLMSHCKTDNHSPLCCQTSIHVPCSNYFQQSVMPLLLETASLAAVFNAASTPVNGDIITHIKCIYPHQRGTIHRSRWTPINSEL